MKLEDYALTDFFQLAATSDIYQAAREIGCCSATVKRRIVQLEQERGHELFIKPLGQDVRLTWHGRELLRELE